MTKPLVSIITPCYNGEAFLKRYFESILNQTYPNLELIFINDGSTDRTEEIALSYRERLEKRGITYIYEKQENAGQAAALNRGLKLFTGEYLTWPDSDDVMTKDSIEKKSIFLRKIQSMKWLEVMEFISMKLPMKKRELATKLQIRKKIFLKIWFCLGHMVAVAVICLGKVYLKRYIQRGIFLYHDMDKIGKYLFRQQVNQNADI